MAHPMPNSTMAQNNMARNSRTRMDATLFQKDSVFDLVGMLSL